MKRILKRAEIYNNLANLCVIVILTQSDETYEVENYTFNMQGEGKGSNKVKYMLYGAADEYYNSIINLFI